MDSAAGLRAPGDAVCIVTMGCAKNEVDSRTMARRLAAAGFRIVDDPETASCIIVNTCSFIEAATEESIAAVLEACDLAAEAQEGVQVVVAGCMPARYGTDLESAMGEVGAFVPCSKEDDIVSVVRALGIAAGPTSWKNAHDGVAPSAYVKISDGCDRFCSYCTIPFIRGRYRSFSFEDIEREVCTCISQGAREIVLIGQDTGRWGADFEPRASLADLVCGLAEAHTDTWFRIMYLQPEGVTDELLDVMAAHDNICPYLDIPFQHANKRIIKAMNRSGSAQDYARLVKHVRTRLPQATVRTTVITGFPGETDEEFEELCAFLEDVEFDYVGVFAYSQEDGTRAAALDGQIDESLKVERAQRVRDLGDQLSWARLAARVGTQADVLVLGREEDGQLFGRAMCQAPDVDGVTFVSAGQPGDVVRVLVSDTLMYEMEGETLG